MAVYQQPTETYDLVSRDIDKPSCLAVYQQLTKTPGYLAVYQQLTETYDLVSRDVDSRAS